MDLPLHEILLRVNPGLLTRRTAQRHVDVPPEVTGPFGGQTKVTICTTPLKPGPASREPIPRRTNGAAAQPAPQVYSPAPPSVPAAPMRPNTERLPSAPVFTRNNAPSRPPVAPMPPEEQIFKRAMPAAATPPPPAPPEPEPELAAEEPIFKRAQPVPARPPSPPVYSPIAAETEQPPIQSIPFVDHTSIPAPAFSRPLSPNLPMTPPSPVALPTPDEEPEPIRFNPSFAPEPIAATPPPAPPAPPAPRETVFLTLSLAELSAAWPEAVREEIAGLNLSGAAVALPQGMIEATLKRGKMVFPWKMVRTWIKPPLMGGYSSPNDAAALELPLKVVTPAFLASLRTVKSQKKVAIDAAIPNLFSGTTGGDFTGATAAPAPAPARAPEAPDTNYYVWRDKNEPQVEEAVVIKKGPSPGTSFLQRYATPNEIVSKAAALNGVGGSLIALPDGLLVASKIPKDLNADTLAAFLPQIFGRVSQSTRELRMGDLNNLNFTVGLIPWKIFRVGASYFAAFGIAGQSLPTAQLAGIAAELDRKPK